MTVLAAIIDWQARRAWLASDSAATSGAMVHAVASKITRVGPALIGTCGAPAGDLYLRQVARNPPADGWPTDHSGAVAWLDALALGWRAWAHEHHLEHKDSGDTQWWALVAMPWGLWQLGADGSVVEVADNYAANGSGALCALGVFHAATAMDVVGDDGACLSAERRLCLAIEAAIAHADGCGGPVRVEMTEVER